MRRMFLAAMTALLTGTALLVVPHAPAVAASVIRVPGHAYESAGLHHWSNQCGEPWFTAGDTPKAIYRADGTMGDHATGFDFAGTNNEAGPWVSVPHPSQLTNLQMSVWGTPGDHGHLIAYYFPPNDTDILVGVATLNKTVNGWGVYSGLATLQLTWHWIDALGNYLGEAQPAPYKKTVQGMAQVYGSDGGGAVVMVTFGCEGHPFYFDEFVVGSTTYDFEGVPTSAVLRASGGRSSVTVDQGSSVSFAGYGTAAADGHGSTGGVFTGAGGLYKVTAGGLTLVARKAFRPGSAAYVVVNTVTPGRYVFRTDASDSFESATSSPITVNVRSRIRGSLLHRTVRTGSPVVVTGRIWPGQAGARLSLQRKVGRGWRTIARGRSHLHGTFRLSKRATTTGTMRLRVVGAGFAGYLGDATPTFKVKVVAPKPPPSPPAPVVSTQHVAPPPAAASAPQTAYEPGHDHKGVSPFG